MKRLQLSDQRFMLPVMSFCNVPSRLIILWAFQVCKYSCRSYNLVQMFVCFLNIWWPSCTCYSLANPSLKFKCSFTECVTKYIYSWCTNMYKWNPQPGNVRALHWIFSSRVEDKHERCRREQSWLHLQVLDNTQDTVGCMINIAVEQEAEDKSLALLKI